ncbi:MAG: hypothetical protein NVS3B10_04880 [Polyangiales bacterium]
MSSRTVRSRAASAGAHVLPVVTAWFAVAAVAIGERAACSTDVDLGGSADGGLRPDPTLEGLGDICEPCTTAATCPANAVCVQIAGNLTFCATACPKGTEGRTDETCQLLTSAPRSAALQACAPKGGVCAPAPPPPAGDGGVLEHCGTLEGPTMAAACRSCDKDDKDCQPNGCYAGWWCNTASNRCRKPPATCP